MCPAAGRGRRSATALAVVPGKAGTPKSPVPSFLKWRAQFVSTPKKRRVYPASGNPRRAAGFGFTGQSGLLRRFFCIPAPCARGVPARGSPYGRRPGPLMGHLGIALLPLNCKPGAPRQTHSGPYRCACHLPRPAKKQGKRPAQSNPPKKRGGGAKTPTQHKETAAGYPAAAHLFHHRTKPFHLCVGTFL